MRKIDQKIVDGPYVQHFKNGQVSVEGYHIDGKKTGEWKYFLTNGVMSAIGHYENGCIVGEWSWWRKNGELW
ncbi:MAG: hypothetical protein P8N58_04425, partial [Emcibacteraceae bacterium]|nr:hypothetical protein [Emcibacteraceae bacterium]